MLIIEVRQGPIRTHSDAGIVANWHEVTNVDDSTYELVLGWTHSQYIANLHFPWQFNIILIEPTITNV